MNRIYYTLWYRLDNKDRFLIWFNDEGASEDLDGVFVDAEGIVPIFISQRELVSYCSLHGITIKPEEPTLHNLDVVKIWLHRKRPEPTPRDEFMSTWNLFADMSRSINGAFDSDKERTNNIYHKAFWGNNYQDVSPHFHYSNPTWSKHERQVIREVLGQGYAMFRNHVRLR